MRVRPYHAVLLVFMVAINLGLPEGSALATIDWSRQHVAKAVSHALGLDLLAPPAIDRGDRNGLNPR